MKRGDVEIIREGLRKLAAEKFVSYPMLVAGANIAIDEYCDAKLAEFDLVANTISSYSIQGRSITKRNIGDIDWGELTENLLRYFDASDLPFRVYGNRVISIDFTLGAL